MSATLEIKVQPRAKRNAIEVSDDGSTRVRVTAAPDKGKANDAVVRLLSDQLGVSKSSIAIVRGHTSRTKVIGISGLTSDEVRKRLRLA